MEEGVEERGVDEERWVGAGAAELFETNTSIKLVVWTILEILGSPMAPPNYDALSGAYESRAGNYEGVYDICCCIISK